MAEDEGNLVLIAGIGQPVPIECRFTADDEVLGADAPQGIENTLGVSALKIAVQAFLTAIIDDADVQRLGVQIDTSVE